MWIGGDVARSTVVGDGLLPRASRVAVSVFDRVVTCLLAKETSASSLDGLSERRLDYPVFADREARSREFEALFHIYADALLCGRKKTIPPRT